MVIKISKKNKWIDTEEEVQRWNRCIGLREIMEIGKKERLNKKEEFREKERSRRAMTSKWGVRHQRWPTSFKFLRQQGFDGPQNA